MKYRADIDGLRTVAVLSVIFYHLDVTIKGFRLFQGGFLGVDIFFVISGYLMGHILIGGLKEGNFSLKTFYERRARRILPALFVVMAASLPFAWMYVFPEPLTAYAKSIVTSVLFGSNFLFWTEGGYTAGPNALKPFLHTWSLSIEEQFYLLFPLALLAVWKFARNHLTVIMFAGLAGSLCLAQWAAHHATVAGFYLLPTRGWELLAGSMLAKWKLDGKNFSIPGWDKHLPWAGLFVLAVFISLFKDSQPHPSWWTLVPVMATMLIIHYGGGADAATRILSLRPVVFLGLISYSLYLWHQPVFAFARLRLIEDPGAADKAVLLALTFILSFLSWKFIERPFRDQTKFPRSALCAILSIGGVALIALNTAIIAGHGIPGRFAYQLFQDMDRQKQDLTMMGGRKCHEREVSDACTLGPEDAKDRWIIVGDSHMGYLSSSLWQALDPHHAALTILTKGGCPYAPGMTLGKGEADHPCQLSTNDARRELLLRAKPSTVIIGGRLPYYLSGKPFDNGEGGKELQQGSFTYGLTLSKGTQSDIQKSLTASLKELLKAGHRLVIIYPSPEMGWDPAQTIRKNLLSKSDKDFAAWMDQGGVSISSGAFHERAKAADAVYNALGNNPQIIRIYPEKLFCDTMVKSRCVSHDKDKMYYSDQDHLSKRGNQMLVTEILNATHTPELRE